MADRPPESPAHGDTSPQPEHLVHEEVGYEATQVPLVRVVLVLLGIAAVFALAGLIANYLVRLKAQPEADAVADSASYHRPSDRLPREPRLEHLDAGRQKLPENVFAMQLSLERELNSYGKTTEGGFVHIPINEAIRIAVDKIPARTTVSRDLAHSFGLVGAGESSSGRNFQEAPSWLSPAD